MCIQDCVYVQSCALPTKDLTKPKLLPLANLEALCKQEVKAKAEL